MIVLAASLFVALFTKNAALAGLALTSAEKMTGGSPCHQVQCIVQLTVRFVQFEAAHFHGCQIFGEVSLLALEVMVKQDDFHKFKIGKWSE